MENTVNDKTFISDKISASLSKSEDLTTDSEHHLGKYYYCTILHFTSNFYFCSDKQMKTFC